MVSLSYLKKVRDQLIFFKILYQKEGKEAFQDHYYSFADLTTQKVECEKYFGNENECE